MIQFLKNKKEEETEEDFSPDLIPVLGQYYVYLAVTCIKEISQTDFITGATDTNAMMHPAASGTRGAQSRQPDNNDMALDELAHISLQFAMSIYMSIFNKEKSNNLYLTDRLATGAYEILQ
eukprot:267542_1